MRVKNIKLVNVSDRAFLLRDKCVFVYLFMKDIFAMASSDAIDSDIVLDSKMTYDDEYAIATTLAAADREEREDVLRMIRRKTLQELERDGALGICFYLTSTPFITVYNSRCF